jgi:peroxiredoxin
MAKIKTGAPALPFTLPGTDDLNHALSDYCDNAVLVLIFSCNHCPYVRAWEDRMIEIQSDYEHRGVQLIVINANDVTKYPEDSFPKMKERVKNKGYNFPYLYDETQEVARSYGAERTPEVFVFDQQRTLRYHGAIDDNFQEPDNVSKTYLRDTLDALLAGETPPMAETRPVGCTIKWK